MALENIISIAGKPGLFKLVSQMRTGFIIQDVSTGKKTNIPNSSQVSLLDNISIYTQEAEAPLFEVFRNIAKKEEYKATIAHKASHTELREFMEAVLPEYDQERVYDSDIKKLIQWYNILQKGGFITEENFKKLDEKAQEAANQAEEAPQSEESAE